MINKPWQVYCFFFIILWVFCFPKIVKADTLFEDNFNDGNFDGWIVARNRQNGNPSQPCLLDGQPSNWSVTNDGKIGINISGPECITEIMPDDSRWNPNWNNYIFEADFIPIQGIDSNIAFRYSGPPNYYWYDYHKGFFNYFWGVKRLFIFFI